MLLIYGPSVEAAAVPHESGSSSCLHSIHYFLPFRSLERAELCYARIKNKCCRNRPAGNEQQEAFVAWLRRPCGEKPSIRPIFQHVLPDNNDPHSGLTSSSENKEAPFSFRSRRLRRRGWAWWNLAFHCGCSSWWASVCEPHYKVRRALQSLQITTDKVGDPAGLSQYHRQSMVFLLVWCSDNCM